MPHRIDPRFGAMVVARPTRDRQLLDVCRLPPADALLQLISFPRLLGWERPTQRQQFELAVFCESVPAFVAEVPWGPPFAPNPGETIFDSLDLREAD